MFDAETIKFVPESELRQPVPEGTIANVRVRPDKEGALGDFRSGESQYGPWMLVPFEVVDGPHRGEWASMMLSVKPTDRKFRAVFEVVTGIDLSSGANVTFAEFKAKLISGVFKAQLGPEKRKGAETGFTTIFGLSERVGERDEPVSSESATVSPIETAAAIAPTEDGSEDIPF